MEDACNAMVAKAWNNNPSYVAAPEVGGNVPAGVYNGYIEGKPTWSTGYKCQVYRSNGGWVDYYSTIYKSGQLGYACPANSTYAGNQQCGCNRGYDLNKTTLNSCSKVQESNQTQAAACTRSLYGCPIDPLAGSEIWYVQTGVGLRGAALTLTYDSVTGQRPASADNITSLMEPNGFGALWHSNFHHALQVAPTKKTALLTMGDARVLSFTGDGTGNFTASGFNNASLVASSGNYVFTDINSGTVEVFNTAGQLRSLARTDGATLNFAYTDGNLTSVTDGDGRAVAFVYTNNLVTKIVGPDGQATTAAYDANKNLASLTWADGKTRRFLYEDATHLWALTGVVDENGDRHATFAYDAAGRVISEEFTGGVQKYTVSYTSGPTWLVTDSYDAATDTISRVHSWQAPVGTVVTTPNGQTLQVGAQTVLGMSLPSTVSQPAGSGNVSAGTTRTYDANGNVTSYDDASGNRSCSLYDSRNRETVRVDGLMTTVACSTVTGMTDTLPEGARRVSTSWHADWKLPATVTEPLRKTTFVYQGQSDPFNANLTANCTTAAAMPNGKPLPLLCKRVEQSLSSTGVVDSTVSPRVHTFSYDVAGRVVAAIDPNGRTLTRRYYADTLYSEGPYDSQFENVGLLLHGNGENGSTAIADSGPSAKAVTAAGNAKISTALSRFGNGSLLFDGSGDFLSVARSDDWDFLTGDFTVEGWFRFGSHVSTTTLVGNYQNASTGWTFQYRTDVPGLSFGWGDTFLATAPFSPGDGVWYHLAVTRANGVIRLFANGSQVGTSVANSSNISGSSNALLVGALYFNGYQQYYNGSIDDLRITRGFARYTSGFSVPAQELSHTGPDATAVGHSRGDAAEMTDAAGHLIQFNLYDRVGRLRQVTDAKGMATSIEYTPRGAVARVTVAAAGGAARVTSYSYDDAGQVTALSLPDGTSLSYRYDAAHRLVGVTDARGNSITYGLDGEGNRVSEDIKDSTGALRRSISRSFDALNRLQQVTGGMQ